MKSKKIFMSIALVLLTSDCYLFSKAKMSTGMLNIINVFLEQEDSMSFVHEIIKTQKMSQKFFEKCASFEEQKELYKVKGVQGDFLSKDTLKKDLYQILSVSNECSQEEIKNAYTHALEKLDSEHESIEAKKKELESIDEQKVEENKESLKILEEQDGEMAKKREEIQGIYSILGEPFKRSYYDLETDIKAFMDYCKKLSFYDRMDFLEILYENRSFVDSIFDIALDNIHADGSHPLMMKFIELSFLDKDFFEREIYSLERLKMVCFELKEFSTLLKDSFSNQVKKKFNIWIRKQMH